MISGVSAAISALYAFGSKLSSVANNTANVNTEGYKKTVSTITEGKSGLPEANLMQSDTPGAIIMDEGLFKETSNVNLAEEFPQMMIAQRGYEANIKSLEIQNETEKSLLDMLV